VYRRSIVAPDRIVKAPSVPEALGARRDGVRPAHVPTSSLSDDVPGPPASSPLTSSLSPKVLRVCRESHQKCSDSRRRRHGGRSRPSRWCTRLSASSSPDAQRVVGVGVTSSRFESGRWISRTSSSRAARAAPAASKFAAIVT